MSLSKASVELAIVLPLALALAFRAQLPLLRIRALLRTGARCAALGLLGARLLSHALV